MKKIFQLILLAALLGGICNPLQAAAYTVTPVTEAPQWQINWSYNQTRPDWQEPAAEDFENWTVMLVKIEKALLPYISADDLLAIYIDNELRGLSKPTVIVSTSEVDATQFLLKVYGNESYGDVVEITMEYYNAQLGQVFALSTTMALEEDLMLGFDEDFIPQFTHGSAKYPWVTLLNVPASLAEAGITPAEGDIVGAFVGDECRGVWTTGDNDYLDVFQREEDETVVLKYYDAAGKRVITFGDGEDYLTGDTSGDGVVDVSDYISIANYIMGNAPEGFNEKAADVNGDGVVDVSDYIGVANLILYGNVNGK